MRPRFALAAQFGWVISGLGHKSLSSVIRPRRRQEQQREQQHPLSLLVRQRSVASFSQRERENGREREGVEQAHTWVIGAACAFARQPKGASQETATGAAVAGVGGQGVGVAAAATQHELHNTDNNNNNNSKKVAN